MLYTVKPEHRVQLIFDENRLCRFYSSDTELRSALGRDPKGAIENIVTVITLESISYQVDVTTNPFEIDNSDVPTSVIKALYESELIPYPYYTTILFLRRTRQQIIDTLNEIPNSNDFQRYILTAKVLDLTEEMFEWIFPQSDDIVMIYRELIIGIKEKLDEMNNINIVGRTLFSNHKHFYDRLVCSVEL